MLAAALVFLYSRTDPAARLGYFIGSLIPLALLGWACYRWKVFRYVVISLVVVNVVCKTLIAVCLR